MPFISQVLDVPSKPDTFFTRVPQTNIKVHNKDLKYTAYTTLARPQMEYASTVWCLHTTTNIAKLEAVQLRVARWATCGYHNSSSVIRMLKDLNSRTLEQRWMESRHFYVQDHIWSYRFTCSRLPCSKYKISHPLAYRHHDYYKYTFFLGTIVHWIALDHHIPVLPTVAQFSHAVCQVVHISP